VSWLTASVESVAQAQPLLVTGRVEAVRGLTVLAEDLPLPVGSLVSFRSGGMGSARRTFGEVVGFTRGHAVVMPLGQLAGVMPGDAVVGEQASPTGPVGFSMLGRCVDGLGRPIDGRGPVRDTLQRPMDRPPITPLRRRRITQQLSTGVRAIDLMTTLGRGQRLGIFAGPGVGKSTLLGSIARGTDADVNVIALIGERGREVKDFIEHNLGPSGLARSVVIVATGDESPPMRVRAAKLACTVAEYYRDAGLDVLLMMDSVTRFAHSQRQIGLSVGEPPATKGYTPSVFAQMALLLERAGAVEPEPGAPTAPASLFSRRKGRAAAGGSITGLYTILVEGDDMTEPVSDAARGILDGHVMLSRKLAQKGQFPAVDVLDSVSRVADDVITKEHAAARRQVARMLALYRDVEDLVQIGAYARGSNPDADVAIDSHRAIVELLKQSPSEAAAFEPAREHLLKLARQTADQVQLLLRSKGR